MRNPLVAPELRELLDEGRHEELRALLEDLHPNDAASILSGLDDKEIVQVLGLLPIQLERDVFLYFEPELQEDIVLGSGRDRLRALLKAIPSDERYEFLDQVDERVRAQLVPLLEQAARADLARREQVRRRPGRLAPQHRVLRAEALALGGRGDRRDPPAGTEPRDDLLRLRRRRREPADRLRVVARPDHRTRPADDRRADEVRPGVGPDQRRPGGGRGADPRVRPARTAGRRRPRQARRHRHLRRRCGHPGGGGHRGHRAHGRCHR